MRPRDQHVAQAPDDSVLGNLRSSLLKKQIRNLQGISTFMSSYDVHRDLWREESQNIHTHFRDGSLVLRENPGLSRKEPEMGSKLQEPSQVLMTPSLPASCHHRK